MRLLGFTPTKKMVEQGGQSLPKHKIVEDPTVNNVVLPIVKPDVKPEVTPDVKPEVVHEVEFNVSHIPSVEIPTYTTSTMIMPSKKKPDSELNRKVNLDPLGN